MAQTDHEFLRAFLGERDTPCPGCGYNLRGLTGDVCPECAQKLRIGVGLVEPRLAWFLAGLVGLSVGLGFAGIILIWGVSITLVRGRGGPNLQELSPLIIGAIVEGAALWIWLRSRSRFRVLPLAARIGLAGAGWALSGAVAAWFFTVV